MTPIGRTTRQEALWDFQVTLGCGCTVPFGHVKATDCSRLTPRRQDGSFGALRCPNKHGRRRIVFTASHSTGLRA